MKISNMGLEQIPVAIQGQIKQTTGNLVMEQLFDNNDDDQSQLTS